MVKHGRVRTKIYPYLYIMPALLFFFIFIMYPIVFSFVLSFYKWNGYARDIFSNFRGLGNYIKLAQDQVFWLAFKNTFFFITATIFFQNLFGASLAMLLFFTRMKGSNVWRSIIFFPAVLSSVIIGLVWRKILLSDGLLNQFLQILGLSNWRLNWLGNPVTPIWCIAFVNIWQWSGYNMVIYYAGLQSIDDQLIEAARIDGANWAQVIHKVVLPLLSQTILLAITLNIIGGFKVFDLVYVLTQGGPAHYSEVLTTYMYFQSFSHIGTNKMGYASSIAITLTFTVLAFSIIRQKFLKRRF